MEVEVDFPSPATSDLRVVQVSSRFTVILGLFRQKRIQQAEQACLELSSLLLSLSHLSVIIIVQKRMILPYWG